MERERGKRVESPSFDLHFEPAHTFLFPSSTSFWKESFSSFTSYFLLLSLSLSLSSFPKTLHLFALIPSITGHEFLLESESLSQISFLQVFLSPRESHFRSLLLSVSLTFNHTFYIQVLSTLFQSQGESTKKG